MPQPYKRWKKSRQSAEHENTRIFYLCYDYVSGNIRPAILDVTRLDSQRQPIAAKRPGTFTNRHLKLKAVLRHLRCDNCNWKIRFLIAHISSFQRVGKVSSVYSVRNYCVLTRYQPWSCHHPANKKKKKKTRSTFRELQPRLVHDCRLWLSRILDSDARCGERIVIIYILYGNRKKHCTHYVTFYASRMLTAADVSQRLVAVVCNLPMTHWLTFVSSSYSAAGEQRVLQARALLSAPTPPPSSICSRARVAFTAAAVIVAHAPPDEPPRTVIIVCLAESIITHRPSSCAPPPPSFSRWVPHIHVILMKHRDFNALKNLEKFENY